VAEPLDARRSEGTASQSRHPLCACALPLNQKHSFAADRKWPILILRFLPFKGDSLKTGF